MTVLDTTTTQVQVTEIAVTSALESDEQSIHYMHARYTTLTGVMNVCRCMEEEERHAVDGFAGFDVKRNGRERDDSKATVANLPSVSLDQQAARR